MDAEAKQRHADLLRKAIDESPVSRQAVADATGRTYRTIGYWTSQTSPTMPSGEERVILRKLLGPYDSAGDPVERAVRQSELEEWRQDAVLSEYKRHLRDQRLEATG